MENKIVFLTVARLSKEKGIKRAIESFSSIQNIASFKWIIIGGGNELRKIKTTIKKHNLKDSILLLGKKINPYPFFLLSDYYLMCSFNEAFPVTIDEAHILGLSVIMTKYVSFENQKFDFDFVCENNFHALTKTLKMVLSSNVREKRYQEGQKMIDERNKQALNQYHYLFR